MSDDFPEALEEERIEELKNEFDAEFETDDAMGPGADGPAASDQPAAATYGCTWGCTFIACTADCFTSDCTGYPLIC